MYNGIKIVRAYKYNCAYCNDQDLIALERTAKFIPLCDNHIDMLKSALARANATVRKWY